MNKSKNNFLRLFQLAFIIVSWIPLYFRIEVPCRTTQFLPLIEKLKRVSHRGNIFLFDYIKKLRTSLLLYLSGEYPTKKIEGVRLTKDGIPQALGPLIKYIRLKSPGVIQLTLTILYSTRSLSLGNEPDVSTIEEPGKTGSVNWDKHVDSFWRDLGYFHKGVNFGSVRFRNFHWTTKHGPSGGHALYTSMNDFYNLTDVDKYALKIIGGKKLSKIIDFLTIHTNTLKRIFPHISPISRKISYFPDKEDKVRVIAIGDYFSQTALKPLHLYLNKILRKIPQDCTYDQGSFKTKAIHWEEFYSIDLTAFTDRFPIKVITKVLSGRFSLEYLYCWEHIMVSKPFIYNHQNKTRDVSYKVGTPMGMYSSWPSTTLAHHYVMYYCCKELNIPWKEAKYTMLGDDILIGDHNLAQMYKELINDLGVDFSPLKTHESKTLAEFAKRLLYKGIEITPFPISSINNSIKRYYRLVNLFLDLEERGWRTQTGIPRAISGLYMALGRYRYKPSTARKKFCKYIEPLSYTSEIIMRMIRTQMTAEQALSLIWYHFRSPVFPKRNDFMAIEDSNGVLSSLAVEAFEESNRNFLNDKHLPLGKLAEDLVLYLTSLDESENAWPIFENLEYIPILYAHGHISEVYIGIQKEAYRIDTVGQGDWPLFFRTIAMPLDDRVYFERNNSFTSQAAATLGKRIIERLNLFSGVHPKSGLPDLSKLDEFKFG